MTLATRAGGQHGVDDAVAQRRGRRREGLLDLGAAEHEDARPGRRLAQAREVLVLALEEPAHGRGQQLLEPDQSRLRAVRGGERIADVEVDGEAWRAASSPGPRARARACARTASAPRRRSVPPLSRSSASPSESRPIASRAAGPQTSSTKPTGRPASSLITAACGSVEAEGLDLEVAALVGEQDDPRAGLGQLPYGRRAALEPRHVPQSARLGVERRVRCRRGRAPPCRARRSRPACRCRTSYGPRLSPARLSSDRGLLRQPDGLEAVGLQESATGSRPPSPG